MSPKPTSIWTLFIVGYVCLVTQALGQSDSLALASASTTSGGDASLKLVLTSPAGNEPAGVQWKVNYASSDILAITAVAAPAAIAAGKSVSCNGSSGSYMCLLTGINTNPIANGVVAIIQVTLSPTVTTSTSIAITNTIGASPAGAVIPMSASGGTVTVISGTLPSISGLTCAPTTLIVPATSTCTVTLNRQATSMTSVSLLDDNTHLSVPASTVIAAGSSSASFAAHAGAVTYAQTGTVTATLGTSSKTIPLMLAPAISSVQCNPSTLTFGGFSICTATMSKVPSQDMQLTVTTSNSSALQVPPSVTVPAGSSNARFPIRAGTVVGQVAVIVGLVKRAVVNVTGAQKSDKSGTSITSLLSSPTTLGETTRTGSLAATTDGIGTKPDALSCLPKAVKAGDWITCQAHLGPTPVPDVLGLQVASSSGDVQVPVSISTRPMQSTMSFQGYSKPGSKQQSVAVQVTLGAVTVQDSVIILPSPGPVLTVPGKQMAKTGSTVSFTVSALDANGEAAALSVSKLPLGASFNPRDGNFKWVPGKFQLGSYDVGFTAVNAIHLSSTAVAHIEVGSGKPVVAALVNGASQSAESSCSPGAIASVLGSWLAQDNAAWSDPTGSSTQLGGTTVKVNGEDVRLLYVSGTRVDFICPQLPPGMELRVSTEDGSGSAANIGATMREAAPGIFTMDGSGQGQGMILFPGSSAVAMPRNPWVWGEPAQPGDDLAIRITGVTSTVGLSVKLGNVIALTQSIRPVDNSRGMLEILLTVPPGAPIGDAVPVSIQLVQPNGAVIESNVVTMAIEAIRP